MHTEQDEQHNVATQTFGNGKYEVTERLGRGGMAEVYRAYQGNLDRYVAIKVLHPFLADDPEFKSRFEKEARNIAKLKHPNIVQVYDFENEADKDTYYMVMELVDGPTLKEVLTAATEQGKLLPIGEVVRIIRESASALSYAHGLNMIHRDVKPANLMLDKNNRLVLTDFGIAKIVTGVQFTASGGMVGTPAYMSPEQGLGEQGDERSDLYSLGVIFYQMLTGRLPYDGDTPLAVILKHLNEPVRSPREYRTEVPQELDHIVTRLMAKDPKDRYQTSTELIVDLERFERAQQGVDLSQPGELPKEAANALEETDTLALPKQTTGKLRATGELRSSAGRAAQIDSAARKLAPIPAERGTARRTAPPAAKRRAPFPIWLWILLSALLGVVIFVLNGQGAFQQIASLVGLTTPTSTVPAVVAEPTLTETSLPTQTATPAATQTPLVVVISTTPQPTATPSATLRPTTTPSATVTPSATNTPVPTATPTATATRRPTQTPIPSATFTPSPDPGATLTALAAQSQLLAQAQTATAAACNFLYEEVERTLFSNGNQIFDGQSVEAGEEFQFDITLRNTGDCAWEVNSSLRYREGEFFDGEQVIRVNRRVQPGATYTFEFVGRAPNENGEQIGSWDLFNPGVLPIGEPLEIRIVVFGA